MKAEEYENASDGEKKSHRQSKANLGPALGGWLERISGLECRVGNRREETRVLAVTNHHLQALVHLRNRLILDCHVQFPGRLQHQRGGQVSQSVDRKQDLEHGRLDLGRLRVRCWKLQCNEARLCLARRNLGNSRLTLSDLNRSRSASRFQPRGVFCAQL